jgi:hypothetical protein
MNNDCHNTSHDEICPELSLNKPEVKTPTMRSSSVLVDDFGSEFWLMRGGVLFCFCGFTIASLLHTLSFAPTTHYNNLNIPVDLGPQGRHFQQIPGVQQCVVGCSRGKEQNSTYRAILDHSRFV